MKKIKQILLSSITLIIILVGIILYQMKTYVPPSFICRIPVPDFCGTPDLTENAAKGREIFNTNCAACHKKHVRSTGPALSETDSLVFIKWLINKKNKIDTTKIKEFGINYHRITFSKTLSKKEIADIIEYCHN
jgi:mono/diheme cytochrome c family protein